MSEPLCPRCHERERHRSPSGLGPYCSPCLVEYRMARDRQRRRETRTVRDGMTFRREVSLPHLVESVRFGQGRTSTCTCGETFDGQTDEEMAQAFGAHAKAGNARRPAA